MYDEMTENEKMYHYFNASRTAESLDNSDLFLRNLKQNLGQVRPEYIEQVSQEIQAQGGYVDRSPMSRTAQSVEPKKDPALINVFQTAYKQAVHVFEKSGLNSGVQDDLMDLINMLRAGLNYMGEPVEQFEPLRHLSGLQAPNMMKNAQKVVETTLSCYSLGKVSEPIISENGSQIEIEFSGTQGHIEYRAHGYVFARAWEGSEAIDYIYTPGQGKMSVRSFEDGRWVDKSNHPNYDVKWELFEKDLRVKEVPKEELPQVEEESFEDIVNNLSVNEKTTVATKVEAKAKPNLEAKKEVFSQSSNNDDDDEEIADFPINENTEDEEI